MLFRRFAGAMAFKFAVLAVLFGGLPHGLPSARAETELGGQSETDFLSDLPVVLSVSRLAQRLDETPGAVTIIDRDLIRRSGARDLVDLLRLVPGFQTTTSFESDAPLATYHGRSDDWGNRIQVLVDGRSTYATHLQGSTGMGLQTLSLDEIERVEVLRGSNSAAYGARAFLGVINIVSRDVQDTKGAAVYATAGGNGVQDLGASVGWGGDAAAFRVHADSRADNGLRSAYGANRVGRINLAGTLRLDQGSELGVRLGSLSIDAGHGTAEGWDPNNPPRMRQMGSSYLQLDWNRTLNADNDLRISASHTENVFQDSFLYLDTSTAFQVFNGITIDFSGRDDNDSLTVQWTGRHTPQLRTAAGAELRSERVDAPALLEGRGSVSSSFQRLFFNTEWRPQESLILNVGALSEASSLSGHSLSSRAMVNWHFVPGHTLRYGVSSAFRPPSPFEMYGAITYVDLTGLLRLPYLRNAGTLQSERVFARELGYNFMVPGSALSGDVRAFDEYVTDGIRLSSGALPGFTVNGDAFRVTGLEWQAQWKPLRDTQVMFSQTWAAVDVHQSAEVDKTFTMEHSVGRYAMSLAVLHRLSDRWDLGLTYSRAEDIALMSLNSRRMLFTLDRLDLRLARSFKVGKNPAEFAFIAQNLGGPVRDGDLKFWMDPRALVGLRMDF